ncbi:hypothetical protein DN752_16315 [Echinicola strongylocentroti]|uniref:DUF6089 domain-containing protein n=1 Tax=Echinicola strongylocentroti TaxID=1795355 RepID=A0A2Z4IME0_9BACT|nr:outer membrane beta-barrel protein [Echinicola strongylocentroti]AWW31563.1 hypothetical protein DN752_16315 [Echinicola strongylocentroti]
MRYILFLLFLAITAQGTHAQSFNRFKFEEPWSFGVGGGVTQYFGELYSLWKYHEGVQPDFNVSINARRTIGTNTRLRVEASYIQMSGKDYPSDPRAFRYPRDLHFRARNFEMAFMAEYHWKPVKLYNITRHFLNWYVFAGVGATTNTPKAQLDGEWYNLRPLALENNEYPAVAMVFPMGLGMKYKLNVYMDLFIEGNYRFTLTDYLDDISAYNIKDSYLSLLASYVDNGEGPMPERLRLAVRNPKYLDDNGLPDTEKIRNAVYFDKNGEFQHEIRRGSGLDHRYDGYFTFNVGVEIYFSQDIWENWLRRGRTKKRSWRFW